MNKPNAIVVGTDLTPQTADLLREAVRLAQAYEGDVVLVHAVSQATGISTKAKPRSVRFES